MGKASLTDYALANPPASTGYEAWITTIPEWEEIRIAWESGTVSASQIRRWLIEERGYPHELATRNKIAHLSKQFPRTRRG
jgi:hypothetical protein